MAMSLVYCVNSSAAGGGRRNGIYIGGKANAKSKEWLVNNNISHILNVTPAREAGVKAGVPNFFATSAHFTYKRISVFDNATANLLNHAKEAVGFISKGLFHGSVLVHCQQGVSRSPTCVAFYFMRKLNMTLPEAMEVLKRHRPDVNPIPAFMNQLAEFEERIKAGPNQKESKNANERGEKRKIHSKTGDGDEKQVKRKFVGPMLPPNHTTPAKIGPSLPPASHSVLENDSGEKKTVLIGPSLPPSTKSEAAAIGPVAKPVPPSDVSPPLKESEVARETCSIKQELIGPRLPPS